MLWEEKGTERAEFDETRKAEEFYEHLDKAFNGFRHVIEFRGRGANQIIFQVEPTQINLDSKGVL